MTRHEYPEHASSDSVYQSNTNLVAGANTKVVSPTTVTVGALRNIFASTVTPASTDGADGDIWIQYT